MAEPAHVDPTREIHSRPRVSILLDRDEQMVNLQAVHRLLEDPKVVGGLLQTLGTRLGRPPAFTNRID